MTNKKGYFSFLLVLILVAIILIILQANLESRKYTQTEALQLKRMQAISTNVKEVIHELARQGANDALKEYLIVVAANNGRQDAELLKALMKEQISGKLSLLADYPFSEDYQVYVWCSNSKLQDDQNIINPLAGLIKSERNVRFSVIKDGTYSISDPTCKEVIQDERLTIEPGTKILTMADIPPFKLGSKSANTFNQVIGISIYSQKFNMSGIYFFPTTMNILE
jgi:hypothetical protein